MSRIPYRKYQELDENGRALWDSLDGPRRPAAVNAEGGLVGPFNAWVQAPELGAPVLNLGRAILSATTIDRKLVELAILTTGAHWKAEFEWWAHARMALRHGISQEVIDAVGSGTAPPFSAEAADERAVFAVASMLAATGTLDQTTYDSARAELGDTGMIEVVTVCGYYALVSYTLNAFDVPLPDGVEPHWQ